MDIGYKLKHENPRKNASIFSKIFFGWIIGLIRHGLKQGIELKDLYKTLDNDKSKKVGDHLQKHWNNEVFEANKQNKKPSLLRAIFKTFLFEFMLYGFFWFMVYGVMFSIQPRFLSRLIFLFTLNKDEDNTVEMYICSLLLIIALIFAVLFYHHSTFGLGKVGMRIRVATSSLIYRKITRLNQKSLGQTAAGQVINLLSNDVNRFDLAVLTIHSIWVMPIQVVILGEFMWEQVGISCLAGIVSLAIVSLPLQGYLAKKMGALRSKISIKTDRRVKLMSEILAGVQVIKMYAWEKPFEKVVKLTRYLEIQEITRASYIKGLLVSFMVFNDRLSLCLTVVCYMLLGNNITADKIFSLAQTYNILQLAMACSFSSAISLGAEALVSVKRLQEFLLMEEREAKSSIETLKQNGIILSGVNASWEGSSETLKNISMQIPPGTLCAIVGPVGSGKSSILQLLLEELLPTTGRIQIGGTIAYSSQEPWLFQSTVRNNILFGRRFESSWYDKVVKVCALERDFEQFPQGDRTIVGERGVSLSGGQRARINLARTIYSRADIYLMDDPLSAVDTHVGKHLFDECIHKHLRGKIRILVTHQLQYLKKANLIIVINEGKIGAQGTFDELVNMRLDFTKLLEDTDESEDTFEENDSEFILARRKSSRQSRMSMRNSRKPSSVSIASNVSEYNDEVVEEEESGSDPDSKPLLGYFKATKNGCLVGLCLILLILTQTLCAGTDYWVAYWTNQEQIRHVSDMQTLHLELLKEKHVPLVILQNYSEHIQDPYRYVHSFNEKDSKGFINSFFNDMFDNVQVDGVVQSVIKTVYGMSIYGFLIIAAVIVTVIRSTVFYKVCMLSSINLHNDIFHALMQAPMRFFDTNPSGRILNRFSKDMGSIDEVFPRVLLESVQTFLVLCGILVNVGITNPYIIIVMVLLGIIFLKFRSIYISTAKSLKHIEGITKSPVFSHVNSTLNGLITIRAAGAEAVLIDEFDEHQNVHSAAWYLTISCISTFGLWLDIVCVAFAAAVTFGFVILYGITDVSGSMVGLAISQSIILTGMMQFGMRQTAEVVNQLTSVDRVLQYTTIDNEGPFDTSKEKKPKGRWPSKGLVEFNKLTMKYVPDDPPVLNGLEFIIQPGEKVGIVGRTGAGKSSLIAALFRLAPLEGSILIDNVDTKQLGLSDLRKNISIIPQEPVLFSATLRYNLDPFGEYDDDKIWSALEQVELKNSVDSLDFMVSEGGTNFSLGQRQLICLARAALRDNKILVLDEATANVDHRTDSFIQQTIRKRFKDCTVLTIAHRLNTIMDSDKVLVMSFGRFVEYDHPHRLLQIPDGHFLKMVLETGPVMTDQLKAVALASYQRKLCD